MALLEELLKSSKTHSQSVIVALVAIIAVGTVGGGLWLHNLQSELQNLDALHKQEMALTKKDALVTLHGLEERIGILDEAVKRHQALLEQTGSRLKRLSTQQHSASASHEIEQIAEDLSRSREDLDMKRSEGLRFAEISRSNLTGSGRTPTPAPRRGPLPLMVLAIIAIRVFGAGIWFYLRHRLS
jgi:hypothetical protein